MDNIDRTQYYVIERKFNKIVAKEYYQKATEFNSVYYYKLLRANGGCLDCKRR